MKTTPVSILMASLLGSPYGFTQDHPRGKDFRGETPGQHFMEAWKKADANGDRSLSLEEFSSLPRLQAIPEDKRSKLFERLDKDGNGSIALAEMRNAGPPDADGPHPRKRLWELDTDKSGDISLEEFSAGEMFGKLPPERAQKMFERLDTNKDGTISPEDRPRQPDGPPGEGPPRDGRPNFGKPGEGRPGDGRPDFGKPDEGRPGFGRPGGGEPHRPPVPFHKLDTNGDGSLDFDEFSKLPGPGRLGEDERERIFERADANKDLKLSQDELGSMRMFEHGKGPKGPRPDKPDMPNRPPAE